MPRGKKYTPEQIVTKLRETDVLLSQGASNAQVVRQLKVATDTYHRWRDEGVTIKRRN